MIKAGISPVHCTVANLTGLRYPSLHVVRIRCALIILQMAGHAIGIGQFVISIDMALCAGRRGVGSGEREPSVGVVEAGVGP